MVQQAIVPRNGQAALSTNVIGLEGAEGFSRSDLRVPVLKVVQGTSRMEEAEKHIGVPVNHARFADVTLKRSRWGGGEPIFALHARE